MSGRALRLVEPDGTVRTLAEDPDERVSWEATDFVAAEEMGRSRGHWWSPDGRHVAACRVDETEVPSWWIGNPARPDQPAVEHRYPAAGSRNPDVRLFVLGALGGQPALEVSWDRVRYEYLAAVSWRAKGLLLTVQRARSSARWSCSVSISRPGRRHRSRSTPTTVGIELVPGVPGFLGDGRLVTAADRGGARRLLVDGHPVSPEGSRCAR
ncbi:MAG: DPP IV N-terminal domain-containing protein [Ilumatobacteraceae bacterium]